MKNLQNENLSIEAIELIKEYRNGSNGIIDDSIEKINSTIYILVQGYNIQTPAQNIFLLIQNLVNLSEFLKLLKE